VNEHIVQLIRERFYPLVRFCGPQSAGEVEIEGVRATVYLGELSIWLWPAKSSHNGVSCLYCSSPNLLITVPSRFQIALGRPSVICGSAQKP